MPSTLTSTAPRTGQSTDPARARGLRRTRVRSPCPPVELVAIPRKPTAAEVLVLVSRTRQARIDAGQMSQSRLFDLRAYKSVLAELAYYRRLAHAGAPSAHVATSMPQLVKGLARLHPSWKMTGDPLADRDRHHSAVRRRLRAMVDTELIVWTRGVNLDGEEARTELLLLEPPKVTPAGARRRPRPAGQVAADPRHPPEHRLEHRHPRHRQGRCPAEPGRAAHARPQPRPAAARRPGSATAIRLSHDRHAQLRRAVKRYHRYIEHATQAANEGAVVPARLGHQLAELPRAPWAAFLHLAAAAGHQHPAGTIQALDVMSRQLRALATATDPQRREGMQARAHARHATPDEPGRVWRRLVPSSSWGRRLSEDESTEQVPARSA